MRFDWTDLRIFLHVCEAGSMTSAATRCHLSVAAVSARVRWLEECNGLVLLQRHARGVCPTPAGEVLVSHARVVFDQVLALERDLLHAAPQSPRRIVLLANSSALMRPLADAVADLEQANAGRPILVRESSSEATVQALRSGVGDVGIVSDAVETHGLVVQDLGPDPLMLVVAPTHALATLTGVDFGQALTQPWIAWGEQSALSAHLQMRALALGRRIQPRVTYPALAGVLRLVGRGLGVSVLPKSALDRHAGSAEVACVPLEERWAHRRLSVCHLDGGDHLRARFAERIWRQNRSE
jgi:DNA-binding transcriptional LysR family regulator